LDRKNKTLREFCEHGYLVFLMEAHGHGLSEPTTPEYVRFTTDSMFHYVDDFLQFITEVV